MTAIPEDTVTRIAREIQEGKWNRKQGPGEYRQPQKEREAIELKNKELYLQMFRDQRTERDRKDLERVLKRQALEKLLDTDPTALTQLRKMEQEDLDEFERLSNQRRDYELPEAYRNHRNPHVEQELADESMPGATSQERLKVWQEYFGVPPKLPVKPMPGIDKGL